MRTQDLPKPCPSNEWLWCHHKPSQFKKASAQQETHHGVSFWAVELAQALLHGGGTCIKHFYVYALRYVSAETNTSTLAARLLFKVKGASFSCVLKVSLPSSFDDNQHGPKV